MMKRKILFCATLLFISICSTFAQYLQPAASEVFAGKQVINPTPFRHPFAMIMGPDDSLWITERRGYVVKMNSVSNGTGTPYVKTTILDISALVKFTTSGSGSTMGISQDGMFGIALHPELNKGTGNDYVYLAYCYDSSTLRRTKIVRYTYNRAAQTLTGEVTLLKGIWGSTDHNAGRLVIGNFGTAAVPDYKLVYTVGDKGSNQFSNACDSIESQYTPTTAQMTAGDIHRYNGKILRLNLDGSIPSDNPTINGVQTHIWSYGHRNPQGLTFEKKPDSVNVLVPSGKLYSSEQGPATDDEINIIQSGKNYGWPRISGKYDNGWYRYYQWSLHPGTGGGKCGSYGGECTTYQSGSVVTENTFSDPNYTDPIFDLYPNTPTGGASCNWLTNPTIAPSSVVYYPFTNKIPGWSNSLLITTLKTSSVFRLKLNAAGTAPALTPGTSGNDSVIQYFKTTQLNRYRDIVIGKDGLTFFLLTDSVGGTSGPSAGTDGGVTDRGAIVMYQYTGAVLAIGSDPVNPTSGKLNFTMYPNPVSDVLTVESKRNIAKPLHYQLYDVAGKVALQGSTNRDKFEVRVRSLSRGMYILKVFNAYDISVATEKIIVN